MKIIFDSEEEKKGIAIELVPYICPTNLRSHIKEFADWKCDAYRLTECDKCWIDALSRLEVKR